MNIIDLNSSRCPGCGVLLPEKKLSFISDKLFKDYDHPPLRKRDDVKVSHRGAYYCGACVNDLDRWSIRCDDCGKKMFGHYMMKVSGLFYCPECFKTLEPYDPDAPANIIRNMILINYKALTSRRSANKPNEIFEIKASVKLSGRTPVIRLLVNGRELKVFVLETLPEENFDGKYFITSVRIHQTPRLLYAVQIDGFIADDPNAKEMGSSIGYRFEGFLLKPDENTAELITADTASLAAKGLRYPGYITPGNVRLVGICPDCGKTFTFRSYNFPLMMCEPCYSDDGLDVFALGMPLKTENDKKSWSTEVNGKTFRYYNSFRCRHCGSPYLNYSMQHRAKYYGNYGCAYLGHEVNYV